MKHAQDMARQFNADLARDEMQREIARLREAEAAAFRRGAEAGAKDMRDAAAHLLDEARRRANGEAYVLNDYGAYAAAIRALPLPEDKRKPGASAVEPPAAKPETQD